MKLEMMLFFIKKYLSEKKQVKTFLLSRDRLGKIFTETRRTPSRSLIRTTEVNFQILIRVDTILFYPTVILFTRFLVKAITNSASANYHVRSAILRLYLDQVKGEMA